MDAEERKGYEIMRERFGRDTLLSLATIDGGRPAVRTVNAVYAQGSFYVITYALSGKMRQIADNPTVAVCGEWFTGHGIGENLGWLGKTKNEALHRMLKEAFAAWYGNGHINEADENTVILRIRMTDGVLMSHATRYDLTFSEAEG
ncbi:MAG TPA: pyridoxamine 5'-phosphate oxidase family protein [Candidatus Limiplasma sp.]|nr:pyridoxamine 5'-phosphate oxidase family protein [Candidatus Limiplasma sp.]